MTLQPVSALVTTCVQCLASSIHLLGDLCIICRRGLLVWVLASEVKVVPKLLWFQVEVCRNISSPHTHLFPDDNSTLTVDIYKGVNLFRFLIFAPESIFLA